MFERAKLGPLAGTLVRLEIPASSVIRCPAPRSGRTVTGYGRNIPTDYKVRTIDQKWRRVYAVCCSNVATLYVWHGDVRTIVELPGA